MRGSAPVIAPSKRFRADVESGMVAMACIAKNSVGLVLCIESLHDERIRDRIFPGIVQRFVGGVA